MTDQELRLQCLELALAHAKVLGQSHDLTEVARLQTWFYNQVALPLTNVVEEPKVTVKGKKTADKSPEIFG